MFLISETIFLFILSVQRRKERKEKEEEMKVGGEGKVISKTVGWFPIIKMYICRNSPIYLGEVYQTFEITE
jgi:hypothetical protein